MSSNLVDSIPLRRSNRLKNKEPEYQAFEDPERTPKRQDKGSPRAKVQLNGYAEKNEAKIEESRRPLASNRKRLLESQSNGQKIVPQKRDNLPKEEPVKRTVVSRTHMPTSRTQNYSSQNIHESRSSYTKYVLIVAVVMVVLYLRRPFNKVSEVEAIENLKSLFPHQSDRLWNFVSHGIADTDPFVLLLVHNGRAKLANCLGKHIAETVVRGRTKESKNSIILDGRSEHSNLLLTLKSEMEEHQALVFQNIEYLHGAVAEKLHFILDTYEPWIPGGVYVLTLHVPNINENSRENFSTIRTFLKSKWSGHVKDDDLDPLITRICNFDYVLERDADPCS